MVGKVLVFSGGGESGAEGGEGGPTTDSIGIGGGLLLFVFSVVRIPAVTTPGRDVATPVCDGVPLMCVSAPVGAGPGGTRE